MGATASGARSASAFSTKAERLELFEALVGKVRQLHVFAPRTEANLGIRWDAELPFLRERFVEAGSKAKLMEALWFFANSLHNPHAYYNPPERPRRLGPGFTLDAEVGPQGTTFYVVQVWAPELRGRLRPGDRLVSFDGVPARILPRTLRFWSNQNNWFGIARHLARLLSARPVVGPAPPASRWVFRSRRTGQILQVTRPWRPLPPANEQEWDESVVDPTRAECAAGPADYGHGYRLVAQGTGFCFYASRERGFRAYPIVRQHTFLYVCELWSTRRGGWRDVSSRVAADWDHLKRLLTKMRPIRGLVLDLRENTGGNNPNWFLDWWASGPYKDHFVFVRLHPDIVGWMERKLRYTTNLSERAAILHYLKAWKERRPGQRFAPARPFFCRKGNCAWSNEYVPAHRLVRAPVALLVGPKCVSSCDHVAQVFSEYGFGPVIGEPTAAGYTVVRKRVGLSLGPGRRLGFLMLAISYEVSGKTGKPVEAVPIRLTRRVPRTFANRRAYGGLLVEAAIRELRAWKARSRRRRPGHP